MSEKRRDNKNRILHEGERQRKDGRYEYRYIDPISGETRSIYSWRLTESDKSPNGKKHKPSLRKMERNISISLSDNDKPCVQTETLNSLFDKYIEERCDIKDTTKQGYKTTYNKHIRNNLGVKSISDISCTDIKKLYIDIITINHMKHGTLSNLNSLLYSLFDRAYRNEMIKKNPCDGVMKDVKHLFVSDTKKKCALTKTQQKAFIDYCEKTPKYKYWYYVFTFLLGTGCRIGEMIALRWKDCNFKDNTIAIKHSMAYYNANGEGYQYKVTTPKNKTSIRVIPMFQPVKKLLLEIKESRQYNNFDEIEIDGFNGFVFIGKNGGTLNIRGVNKALKKICAHYNDLEKQRAEEAGEEPILLPDFSIHQLRHTFVVRMCENESNIKVVSEILGHSSIVTTMDVYNEATIEKKKECFEKLEGKIIL